VKVWSVEGAQPQLLVSKDLSLGQLYDVAFCVDAPHLIAAGGGNGKVGVWDATDSAAVCAKLGVQRRETPLGGSVVASGMEVRTPRRRLPGGVGARRASMEAIGSSRALLSIAPQKVRLHPTHARSKPPSARVRVCPAGTRRAQL
jgi:hypothetical protein